MVDQTLVQTGFDIEVLLSARYVTYTLLAQIEAGLLPMATEIVDPAQGVDVRVDLRPPTDYERRYEPDPAAVLPPAADGSFVTEFVFGDPDGANLMLSVVTDILDRTTGDVRSGVTIGLMLAIGLEADVDDRGFESDHRLSISLVKLEPLTAILLAFAGLDVDDVTARIEAQLDRTVTFGVASGQSVQGARLSVLDGGNGRPPAMGVYINLALKDAPEADAFGGDRGNVDDARLDYEANDLRDDADPLIASVLRFDLVPAEFAKLQGAGVLAIAGKEIIRMASGTVYYRDRPDFFARDNLLALRSYRFPYVPPVP